MKSASEIERTAKRIRFRPNPGVDERILNSAAVVLEKSRRPVTAQISVQSWYRFRRLVWAGGLAATFLIISSLVACFVLSEKVTDLKNELEQARSEIALAPADDSATINFYLREHQDTVARTAYLNPATPPPSQMLVGRNDILYYEFFDDQPVYMRPGIIVRGPSSRQEISSLQAPAISNGHTLNLSEARETAAFDLVCLPWLNPGYMLEQIRRIEGHDAMQLLYTDGINTLSLFEQPLDGQSGLGPQDFREYAVYRNKGQAGGTILAWRDNTLSYVLIGNADMPQLMDMAESISDAKR